MTTARPPAAVLLLAAAAPLRRVGAFVLGPDREISHSSTFTSAPAPPAPTSPSCRIASGLSATRSASRLARTCPVPSCRPLGVKRALQDDDSGGLVDHLTAPARVYPIRPQVPLGRDGAQPLVDQAHRTPGPAARRGAAAYDVAACGRLALAGRPAYGAARRPPRRPRARPRARPASARSLWPRRSVTTGVASSPAGSLRATPTRTEPTSTPSRTPALTLAPTSSPSKSIMHAWTCGKPQVRAPSSKSIMQDSDGSR